MSVRKIPRPSSIIDRKLGALMREIEKRDEAMFVCFWSREGFETLVDAKLTDDEWRLVRKSLGYFDHEALFGFNELELDLLADVRQYLEKKARAAKKAVQS